MQNFELDGLVLKLTANADLLYDRGPKLYIIYIQATDNGVPPMSSNYSVARECVMIVAATARPRHHVLICIHAVYVLDTNLPPVLKSASKSRVSSVCMSEQC